MPKLLIGADPNPAGAPSPKVTRSPACWISAQHAKELWTGSHSEQTWTRRRKRRQPEFGAYASNTGKSARSQHWSPRLLQIRTRNRRGASDGRPRLQSKAAPPVEMEVVAERDIPRVMVAREYGRASRNSRSSFGKGGLNAGFSKFGLGARCGRGRHLSARSAPQACEANAILDAMRPSLSPGTIVPIAASSIDQLWTQRQKHFEQEVFRFCHRVHKAYIFSTDERRGESDRSWGDRSRLPVCGQEADRHTQRHRGRDFGERFGAKRIVRAGWSLSTAFWVR